MTPLDYSKTYLLGTNPANEVRFWVESRTRVIDERSGKMEDFLQCASCKSEDTFAEQNLFLRDNYDFLPIFGPEYGLIFRRNAWLNPNYRSCLRTVEMFGGPVQASTGIRPLQEPDLPPRKSFGSRMNSAL